MIVVSVCDHLAVLLLAFGKEKCHAGEWSKTVHLKEPDTKRRKKDKGPDVPFKGFTLYPMT
jgi:hypothetical protein